MKGKNTRRTREEILQEREKAQKIFEESHPGFKVIAAKIGGLQVLAVVKEADYEKLQQNLPAKGKRPRITLAQGANPSTDLVVPITWTSAGGDSFEILGSVVYINDDGKSLGHPGIIPKPKKEEE